MLCFRGGGKTEEQEQESNWFIIYVESHGIVGPNSTDYTTRFTDGTCASGGTSHDGSVVIATDATNAADDTLVITKNINADAIANEHGGSFTFCEIVIQKMKLPPCSENNQILLNSAEAEPRSEQKRV